MDKIFTKNCTSSNCTSFRKSELDKINCNLLRNESIEKLSQKQVSELSPTHGANRFACLTSFSHEVNYIVFIDPLKRFAISHRV